MASPTKISVAIATAFLLLSLLVASGDAQISPMGAASGPSMAMAPVAPSPGSDCLTPLANMSGCLTFVEQGSNLTKPDKECCGELAGLVDSNPICLCQLLGDPGKLGIPIDIDISKALKLPNICSVETPPVSTCAALGIPVAAPTASDEGPAASPGGLASSPTSENKDNSATTMTFSKLHFLLGLAIPMFF